MKDLGTGQSEHAIECPPEQRWFEIASGAIEQRETILCLDHVAACSQCSARLAQALSLMKEDATPEEEKLLGTLASSGEEWQRAMAAKMPVPVAGPEVSEAGAQVVESPGWPEAAVASVRGDADVCLPPRSDPRWFRGSWFGIGSPARRDSGRSPTRFWWGAAVAASFAVALAFAWLYIRPTPVAGLLAEAYTNQRPTELRLDEGDPGKLASASRGDSQRASAEVLRLKLLATEHLNKSPNDGQWHQVLGEIALVEHDGETANREFLLTQVLDPESPELKFDEGLAQFELAESKSDPTYYGFAAEAFQVYLDAGGRRRSSALFDLGLTCERQGFYSMAVSNYEAALAAEKDQAWRKEIQSHLEFVRARVPKSQLTAPQGETPEAFLAAWHADPGSVEGDYERYLSIAGRRWLTLRGAAPADESLAALARIGVKHGDMWLGDLLKHGGSPQALTAGRHLQAALSASASGSTDEAKSESQQAAELFRRAGNRPGWLRARAELVYALQRSGSEKECEGMARELIHESELARYSWLQGYVLLEESSCADSTAGSAGKDPLCEEALALAQRWSLPVEALRAQGFLAEGALTSGALRRAWSLSVSGLTNSASNAAAMRRYQFLYVLDKAAEKLGLPLTAASLADVRVGTVQQTGNRQITAYAFEEAGVAHLAAHQLAAASVAFDEALRELTYLPDGSATALYRADWESDRCAMLAQRAELPSALVRMAQAEHSVSSSTLTTIRIPFYTRYAELLLQAGRRADAQHYAEIAASEAEKLLVQESTNGPAAEQAEGIRAAHVVLVETLLSEHQVEPALRTWEWFRSPSSWQPTAASKALSFDSLPRPPPRELVIAVALLHSDYVVWVVPPAGSPITVSRSSVDPTEVTKLVRSFHALCANRDSSMGDVQVMGAAIYRRLFSGLDQQVTTASTLRLHLDDSLRSLPMDALVTGDHTPLGQRHALLLLADGWPVRPLVDTGITGNERALIVKGPVGGSGQRAYLPAEYDESDSVASMFRNSVRLDAQSAAPQAMAEEISKAEVFHFAGHSAGAPLLGRLLAVGGGPTIAGKVDSGKTEGTQGPLRFAQCKIAVLAACNTADADPDALLEDQTLTDAVLRDGAAQVVASGWEVDSATTRDIMVNFYKELLRHKAPAVALQLAKEAVRKSPATQHPYYWSAFQIYTQ